MNPDQTRVVVVPCSGIGKPFGTVSREAAYDLCDELRPESTRLVALAKLVLGDPEARELLAQHPATTPISPPSGPATGSVNGLHPKRRFPTRIVHSGMQ